jgi:hypothetical protein
MNPVRCLQKSVVQGGRIPWGWRRAWQEPKRRAAVYSPAGLHWIFRLARELVHRVCGAIAAPSIEVAEAFEIERTHRERQRLAEEYSRGYLAGWRGCFDACMAAVEDELANASDVWEMGELLSGQPQRRN